MAIETVLRTVSVPQGRMTIARRFNGGYAQDQELSPVSAGRLNRSQRVNELMETTTQPPVSTIAKIGQHEGETVTIQGWLYNLRESGKLLFPIFRDGTGVIQGVVPK